jgi:hypothetical protein
MKNFWKASFHLEQLEDQEALRLASALLDWFPTSTYL